MLISQPYLRKNRLLGEIFMPVSNKQLIANRQNAKKSTGPKTEQGKAIIEQNAIKHGLYSRAAVINSPNLKEDQAEYDLLFESMCDELKPQGTVNFLKYRASKPLPPINW